MSRAVRYDEYGPVEVLHLADVDRPEPGAGEVLVEVVATSINPGEIAIREGAMAEQTPSQFPSGQGSDLAGRVAAVGAGTDWRPGDEVIGWTDERAAQAEYVVVPADQLTARPSSVPWEQAGSLYVAGGTARAMIDAVAPHAGEVALVTGAAGGVGSFLVQLLAHGGVHVIGVAGPDNDQWLADHGAVAVNHGDRFAERLHEAAPDGVDVVLDTFGGGYVAQAVGWGVAPDRIVTISDFDAAEQQGVTVVFGYQSTTAETLADLANLIAQGDLEVPIAATYPLAQVRDAYERLAQRHTRGKIVLGVS